jgi:hypothetical protein
VAFVRLCKSRGGAPVGVRARSAPTPRARTDGNICLRGVDLGQLRLSALRLPFLCSVNETRTRRKPGTLSAPAIAGEGNHWSSRSERTVVEGRLTRRFIGVARQSALVPYSLALRAFTSSPAPLPPPFGWSPFPAIAGQEFLAKRRLNPQSRGRLPRDNRVPFGGVVCTVIWPSARFGSS